jgi:hypothetical protein
LKVRQMVSYELVLLRHIAVIILTIFSVILNKYPEELCKITKSFMIGPSSTVSDSKQTWPALRCHPSVWPAAMCKVTEKLSQDIRFPYRNSNSVHQEWEGGLLSINRGL